MTIVNEDFHVPVVLLLQQSPDSNGKDGNAVIIDYQENTGWLFFKMRAISRLIFLVKFFTLIEPPL